MPQVKALNVKCEKNHMKVNMEFDRPFYGMIFSKGHYSDPACIHLPAGTGHLVANFDIFMGGCGMTSSQQNSYNNPEQTSGLFIENTIIVQYDPQVQEIWDQARRLRCTWYDFYEKAVTFRPFNVDMLDAVTANFLGDNIQCWMQVQVGKGPWASEVSGIVKIGQTMTMVLAIKDDENKFDMMVRNCIAHDGKHQPIQLVDEYGCVVRPKIMSRFQKVKNFGASASVVSYAYFQAFKFPDSMNVHFQCVIQVCRYECPVPKCEGDQLLDHHQGAATGTLGGDYLPAPREPATSYSENKPVYHDKDQEATSSSDGIDSPFRDGLKPGKGGAANYPGHFYNRQGDQLPDDTTSAKEEDDDETVEKKGDVSVHSGPSFAVGGGVGMPRSLDINRKKRQLEMTDIQTQRVIQVVAPGDVAFTLPTGAENQTVIDVYATRSEMDASAICMSLPGFVAGLIILLLLLIVSSLVAAFLFLRVRHLSGKGCNSSPENIISYDNAEFVKVAVPVAVAQ